MKRLITVINSLFVFYAGNSMATVRDCHPTLWPSTSPIINASAIIPQDTLIELRLWAKKLMKQPSYPIAVLGSSGAIDIKNDKLIASRKAFQDADHAAVLAITYRLTHNEDYFNKTREILTSWAKVNLPTGNPIDETRLDGMIWAYDLISCDLSDDDKTQIVDWFERLRSKKKAWSFGSVTSSNNHRIHQLKMLLLLDKVLGYSEDWLRDLKTAQEYSTINLNPESGISLDYRERNALYYHNYVTQAWLEIALITGCCWQPIDQAFSFLSNKILSHDIGNEFTNSQAPIDALRAQNGFEYAKTGGTFDITRAAPTIITFYTINKSTPEPKLWIITEQTKPSPQMIFLKTRRILW
jgi:hypothetical protein